MRLLIFTISLLLFQICTARHHHLEVRNDFRRYIAFSSFGFYKGGLLDVKLNNFKIDPNDATKMFGITLDKTMSDAMNPYLDTHQDRCILQESATAQQSGPIAFFTMDLMKDLVHIRYSTDWQTPIYKNRSDLPIYQTKSYLSELTDSTFLIQRRKRELIPEEEKKEISQSNFLRDIKMSVLERDGYNYYNINFAMFISTDEEEGLYNLYFHSCPNYYLEKFYLNFDVVIEENNSGNFLSAGEMPLPALYFMMSVLFCLSGLFWVYILRSSKHSVFKIHYLMAVLVFLKSLSLLFHSINFHFIEVRGEHVETWAILYYITHLMKGAVLFITIVLIGTGWTFIKHILADRDKKVFMIVIPLQVLANIAEIIIAESEEGAIEHKTWRDIFILVDLLCCGAILFPVVWSIRHLQEASATDGKAATNLKKLKLFRQFYIMIVCYIYFTRIIVYLLKITVAFQYAWLDEMFREMATYVFFVLTGYKFRPLSVHPYFSVDTDEESEEVEILTENGLTEGLSKVTNRTQPTATIIESNEDETESLISKRESSHEYD